MIIFCDTNIVLEYLQQRRYFAEVGQIITSALQQGDRTPTDFIASYLNV